MTRLTEEKPDHHRLHGFRVSGACRAADLLIMEVRQRALLEQLSFTTFSSRGIGRFG